MVLQYGKNSMYYPPLGTVVVSDLHSHAANLRRLLQNIFTKLDPVGDDLVFAGDLLDGKLEESDPASTLMQLRETKEKHKNTFFIEGNHEEMFKHWLRTGEYGTWRYADGFDTVSRLCKYFGIHYETFFDDHLHWQLKEHLIQSGLWDIYSSMIPYYETEQMIVTHAPLDRQMVGSYGGLYEYDESRHKGLLDRMYFELKWQFTLEADHFMIPELKKFLVCGHQFAHHKQPRLFKTRAFLDAGCGKKPNAPAVAMRFPGKKVMKSSDLMAL